MRILGLSVSVRCIGVLVRFFTGPFAEFLRDWDMSVFCKMAGSFWGRLRPFFRTGFFTVVLTGVFVFGPFHRNGFGRSFRGTVAQRGHLAHARTVPGQWLVKFRLGGSGFWKQGLLAAQEALLSEARIQAALAQIGGREIRPLLNPHVVRRLRDTQLVAGIMLVKGDPAVPFRRVQSVFGRFPDVEYVEPAFAVPILLQPDDPQYPKQSHLPQIQAPQAWDFTVGDSSVVIAVVDNGFDLRHLDLRPNLWTNWQELSGEPGIDDDGNGYVDDVHGFDFAENDPDPSFSPLQVLGYRHGTHVAGIVAAVGNNGVGVTGVTWNCRILPLKAALDDDPMSVLTPAASQAIVYAVAAGARVINLSWGAYGYFSRAEVDAINLAYRNGAVVVAAAGNDHVDNILYPAGHHHVLSVSWVDGRDILAFSGNYGKTVDLVAPGVQILSTLPDNSFGRESGSSMAAPVVAGVAGLVWAAHPDWTVDEVIRHVAFSADPVDDKNPDYRNLLGSGRVNAFRALQDLPLQPPPAKILVKAYSLNDSLFGNGNQLIESGERIALTVTLSNGSLGGSPQASFQVRPLDSVSVDFETRSVIMPVPPDSDFALAQPFVFRAPGQDQVKILRLLFSYSGENVLAGQDTFLVFIGRYPILLVDDDDGENNVEGYYETPLKKWRLPFSYWDHVHFGSPSAHLLQQFPVVIWFCEWAFPSLTRQDQAALAAYLTGGGNLFISGQDIGWDLADPGSDDFSESSVLFYENVLRARYIADDAGETQVTGVPGDPIGEGLAFSIYQPGRSTDQQFPDVIEPLDSARAVWNYTNGKGDGGLRYRGEYRLVYFGFGLEAINNRYLGNPAKLDSTRSEVFLRVLDFLHPLRHTPLTDLTSPVASVPVRARYAGPGQFPPSVVLHFRFAGDSAASAQVMQRSGDTFAASLPLEGVEGEVYYWFEIQDPDFTWYLPVRGAARPFHFRIGKDTQPPEIFPEHLPNQLAREKVYRVTATVRDNAGLDSNAVWAIYRYRVRAEDSVRAVYRPGVNLFAAEISGDFRYGDVVHYWFTAQDEAAPPNTAVSDPYAFQIGLDDFESGLSQWVRNDDRWALCASDHYSGNYCLTTEPDQSYGKNLDLQITTRNPLDFTGAERLELQFYTHYAIETGDRGQVELRVKDGPWRLLAGPFVGYQGAWKLVRVNLAPFLGNDRCFLRFRFLSDTLQTRAMDGWFIDDVRIVQDEYITDVRKAGTGPSARKPPFSVQLFPNPLTGPGTIVLMMPRAGEARIAVYNLLGQRVWYRKLASPGPGRYFLPWPGRDRGGNPLPAGVYWLQLLVGRQTRVRKIVILR